MYWRGSVQCLPCLKGGGTVERSIGYIAYQNRNSFGNETEAYEYVWDIIHYVYGDIYDKDYKPAWSKPVM